MKKLTDKWIKSVKGGQYVARTADNQVKGLTLAITPAGTKTFWIKYTIHGKKRQHKLGVWPDYSLDQARIDARAFREKLSTGEDPGREYKAIQGEVRNEQQLRSAAYDVLEDLIKGVPDAELAAMRLVRESSGNNPLDLDTPLSAKERLTVYREAGNSTVAALFTLYEADLLAGGKLTKEMLAAYAKDIAPYIGTKPADQVTPDDIADLLDHIVSRGAIRKSDIVRGYLMRAFNLGRKAQYSTLWRSSSPAFNIAANPVDVIEKAGEYNPRDRELSAGEVKALWSGLDAAFQVPTALAIKLILATGARVTEILEAKQSEFDLDAGVWALPMDRWKIRKKAKHTQPHLTPLTPFHIALIKQAKQLAGDSEYLFPNRKGDAPMAYRSLNQAIRRFCDRTGFEVFVTKDLRRTFKTLTGGCGLSLEIRNRLQGHAFQDIGSRNYDRFGYWEQKQEAMQVWAESLEAMLPVEPAPVAQLRAVQ